MTLSAVARRSGPYAGTGSATTFAYGFKIFSANDLEVYVDDSLVATASYSVTGIGAEAGGNIVFTTAPAAGTTIWIFGGLPIEQQDVDLVPGGSILDTDLETALDKQVMRLWERIEELERRPALKKNTTLRGLVIPDPVALNVWQWNATADGLTQTPGTILQVTPDATTGLSFVKTATTVTSSNGAAQLTASNAFPAGSEALLVAARITTAFGTSGGLTGVALGDPTEGDDVWAASMAVTLDAVSNVGQHTLAKRLFNNAARDVLITALGGPFDATGQIKVTTWSVTGTPDT